MTTSQDKQVGQEIEPKSGSESGAQPTAQPQGSGNPDHQGGKVQSAQPDAGGTVAATEEEKGGSSD